MLGSDTKKMKPWGHMERVGDERDEGGGKKSDADDGS